MLVGLGHPTLFAQAAPTLTLKLTPIVEKLTAPVALAYPPDSTDRLFIVEQSGQIWIRENAKVVTTPFLNIRNKIEGINPIYSEKGLLGMAFHPNFQQNRKFYIYYSASTETPRKNHKSILAELAIAGRPNIADTNSLREVLSIEQPEANHNGGHIVFGPDGMLYIGLGDGGGAGDKHGTKGNAQDLSNHLGKILRIDVNAKKPYGIPKDNPFINQKDAKPEIWAYGLRNPWKFSFDRQTGELFCGDVGQNDYEEINIIQSGKNYGWRIMEGFHCYNPSQNCNTSGLTAPIHEYSHKYGKCIIGGYVYRGKAIPALVGKYVFADWTGKLFYLEKVGASWRRGAIHINGTDKINKDINSLGEDKAGELYILTQEKTAPTGKTGAVYKLER